MKNILKIIILSLLAFLCTGCASVDYTMTINKDDSADLEYIIRIDGNSINEEMYVGILDTITTELEINGFIVQKTENEFKAEKKIDNILTLDEFDSLIKLNKASSIVTKEEGIFDYVTEKKFGYASELLLTTDYSVQKIAAMTGYSQTAKELKFDELIRENVDIKFNLNLPVKSKSSNSGVEKSKSLIWNLNYGDENFIEVEYSSINKEVILIPVFTVVIFVIILFVINKRKGNETIKF